MNKSNIFLHPYLYEEDTSSLKVRLAQISLINCDLAGNFAKIASAYKKACREGCKIIVFPELTLSGYNIGDLALNHQFISQEQEYLLQLQNLTQNESCIIIVGHLSLSLPIDSELPISSLGTDKQFLSVYAPSKAKCFNSASVLYSGNNICTHHKAHLPNYGIFSEPRFFLQGEKGISFFTLGDYRCGMLVCEDMWAHGVEAIDGAILDIIFVLNASPYAPGKKLSRLKHMDKIRKAYGGKTHVVYVNSYGGQNELVFDGGSCVMGADGDLFLYCDFIEADDLDVTFAVSYKKIKNKDLYKEKYIAVSVVNKELNNEELNNNKKDSIREDYSNEKILFDLYFAALSGIKSYVEKHNFSEVIISLSGGIDSALVAIMAVDALGPDKVKTYMLPSIYSSEKSFHAGKELVANLKVSNRIINIADLHLAMRGIFSSFDEEIVPGSIVDQNIQARIRGMIIMAASNLNRGLVLNTSNKSESAVGYCTIYGDACGGLAPIADIYKTQVYALAKLRNSRRFYDLIEEKYLAISAFTLLSQDKLMYVCKEHLSGSADGTKEKCGKIDLADGNKISAIGQRIEDNDANMFALIPQSIFVNPPSAELAPGQKDEDNLPKYEVLDQILCQVLAGMMGGDISEEKCVSTAVKRDKPLPFPKINEMYMASEFKRRQFPPALILSEEDLKRGIINPV